MTKIKIDEDVNGFAQSIILKKVFSHTLSALSFTQNFLSKKVVMPIYVSIRMFEPKSIMALNLSKKTSICVLVQKESSQDY